MPKKLRPTVGFMAFKCRTLRGNCFNVVFPLCQRISVCGKHLQTAIFSFSVMLLNKHAIKSYTTSCDVSWCSVGTSFHSTLIFNRLCKYIQNNSIHHMELIYVERQPDRQNGIITDSDHRYW